MAEQTLLQLVQGLCRKRGLPYPTITVTGSSDPWVLQMWELLNEEVREHCNRDENFERLKVHTSFTYLSDPDYNAIDPSSATEFGSGAFRSMVPETLWDDTLRLQLVGPIRDDQWAAMLAMASAPSYPVYRTLGEFLQIYPGNSTPHTISCDYMSQFGVLEAGGGGTLKAAFTVDTDTPLMPTRIVAAGLEWRWLKIKGQPYAEEFRQYEAQIANLALRQSIPTTVRIDNCPDNRLAGPGLLIAAGNWNLP